MIKLASRLLVAGAVAAGASSVVIIPAWATQSQGSSTSSGGSLSHIQAKAAVAISKQLARLHSDESKASANRWLTSTDKSALAGIFSGDFSGLTALKAKIDADTTSSQARSDYKEIFTGYRVYSLAQAQMRVAIRADRLTGQVLPHLQKIDSRLEARAQKSGSSSAGVPLADLSQRIRVLQSETNGISSQVLAFTSAQLDANHSLLRGVHQSLTSVASNMKAARSDIRAARLDLKK